MILMTVDRRRYPELCQKLSPTVSNRFIFHSSPPRKEPESDEKLLLNTCVLWLRERILHGFGNFKLIELHDNIMNIFAIVSFFSQSRCLDTISNHLRICTVKNCSFLRGCKSYFVLVFLVTKFTRDCLSFASLKSKRNITFLRCKWYHM